MLQNFHGKKGFHGNLCLSGAKIEYILVFLAQSKKYNLGSTAETH